MIAKHIKRTSPDSFDRLARYIAAAEEEGEKLDRLWAVNCRAGDGIDDLEHIINEIRATQALNTRAKSDKTYHLMVSFRDEKPSSDALADMERHFAATLGFEDHQRVAGSHRNTSKYHFHVAYNRIHPRTHRIHHPNHDYRALQRICREMEAKYTLKIDSGRPGAGERDTKPAKARDMEARTWEQSFHGYVTELRPELDAKLAASRSWQQLHAGFAEFGLRLRLRGNGLVVSDAGHKSRSIKGSTLGRQYAKGSLENRFGAFELMAGEKDARARIRYERRPTTRHRGQSRLWEEYSDGRKGLSRLDKLEYRSWRQFLEMRAGKDPLARAILKAQDQLVQGIAPSHRSATMGMKP